MKRIAALFLTLATAVPALAQWAEPKAPAVPTADGYVTIPHVAVPPEKTRTYRAVWDATKAAAKPAELVPALNNAGSELNAFAVAGVPPKNVKFVVVFHGPAVDGILNEATYKAKFGVPNPNLPVLAQMKKAGVKLYVCGQHLAFSNIDPKTIAGDVTVASDALIVLMTYENQGYALLSF
jgi:intracellular sulfur oxidation DsrE/DsrF family protein